MLGRYTTGPLRRRRSIAGRAQTVRRGLAARGDAISPPEQVRRFKCRGCGKIEATLDLSTYERLRALKEEKP